MIRRPVFRSLALFPVSLTLLLAACGRDEAPRNGDALQRRAVEGPELAERTGAELQEQALHQVIRTVYACVDGESLTVDFDNRRDMATVRTSYGMAADLFEQPTADGLWYRAEGHELRGAGGRAVWTSGQRPPTECRAVD